MDMYCCNCGEPWDVYCIGEVKRGEDTDPSWMLDKNGHIKHCPCCPKGKVEENSRAKAASIMADLLGDDIDGAAAILEDAEYLGLLDDL